MDIFEEFCIIKNIIIIVVVVIRFFKIYITNTHIPTSIEVSIQTVKYRNIELLKIFNKVFETN